MKPTITLADDVLELEKLYDQILHISDRLTRIAYRRGDAGQTAVDEALTTADESLVYTVAYHVGAAINALHDVALAEQEGA